MTSSELLMTATIAKQLWRKIKAAYLRRRPEQVFSRIYSERLWSGSESASGSGSGLEQTSSLRCSLPDLLRELGVRSMLDAPCGDFHWMSELEMPLERYFGVDIVSDLVEQNRRKYSHPNREFLQLNVISDPLPRADLILCRHLLIHLPLSECRRTLQNFKRSGAEYLLITNQPEATENAEIPMGSFRPLNLALAPFRFPSAIRTLADSQHPSDTAHLALYRLRDLQP